MRNANQLFNSPEEEITSSYWGQKILDIVFAFIFVVLIIFVSKRLYFFGIITSRLNLLTLVVLVFAVFRITKLFIADHITQWFRDLFLIVTIEKNGDNIKIIRKFPKKGLRREIALLLDCPWCTSIWISVAVLYLWVRHPATHFFFYIMAFSGLSVLLYLGMNKLRNK
ncbi:MAG TPA: DUF1360 domain-containing protein [Candidatus Paceibacterota bacterium]|nr:DUF1360 domain-containing protein [Candidatus Paceibacterota bacterium]